MDLLQRLHQEITQRDLFTSGSTVLIAVSGGADSLCLLHALASLQSRLRITLHAATMDHMLRGEESAADARYVLNCASSWGIPAASAQVDVASTAKRLKIGIEEAARLERYRFLAHIARLTGASALVTAHHANDQAETVLMHLIRGAGMQGLGGMAFSSTASGFPHLKLVRPLLSTTRAEIEQYCNAHQIIPREDSTNTDTNYLRNRIRLTTLPHLQALNPRIVSSLNNLSVIIQTENALIEDLVHATVQALAVEQHVDHLVIPIAAFCTLHPALQRRLLLWAVKQIRADAEPDLKHILDAVEMAHHGSTGAVVLLGSGLQMRIEYKNMIIETTVPHGSHNPTLKADTSVRVHAPGRTQLENGWALVVYDSPTLQAQAQLQAPHATEFTLRSRRPGDTFAPPGMKGHHQKLNDWFINRKVPRAQRDLVPLLCVNDDVAAVLLGENWPVSELYAVKDNEQPRFYLILEHS